MGCGWHKLYGGVGGGGGLMRKHLVGQIETGFGGDGGLCGITQ
jgi:hypothetical protein